MLTFPTVSHSLQSVTYERRYGAVNMGGAEMNCAKMKHFISAHINATPQNVVFQRVCFAYLEYGHQCELNI